MTPVADDVSLDNEASMVPSSISRFVGSTQFFEGAYRVPLDSEASMVTSSLKICSKVLIGLSVCSGTERILGYRPLRVGYFVAPPL